MPSQLEPVPVVRWAEFWPRLRWEQGEHFGLCGPTGQGKTTAALALLRLRAERLGYVTIVATKPVDRTLSGLRREGFVKIGSWPPPARTPRVVLWPRWRTRADNPVQAATIRDALNQIYRAGKWCVFLDDAQHLTDELGLRADLRTLWLMGRSLGISVLAATQRPRHVPLEMWSSSTHLLLWRTNDDDDLKRLSGLGAAHTRTVRETVAHLPPWHALYVNTRNGGLVTINLNRRDNH